MATVEQLVDDQQSYAENLADEGSLALRNAQSLLIALEPAPFEFVPVTPTPPPAFSEDEDIPDFAVVSLDLPSDVGDAPPLDAATQIDTTGLPAPFDVPPPDLETNAPEKPFPANVDAFTETVPAIDLNSIDFPTPPSELLYFSIAAPSEPPLRAEPTSPGTLAVQHFEGVAPTDTLAAPDDYEARFAAAYAGASPSMMAAISGYVDAQMTKINPLFHTQMSAIEAQLTRYLAGGTGLNTTVEDAIYSRARERTDLDAARVRDAAYEEAASRGFTLPTGALAAAVARARQEAANNNAKSSTDIAIAQAEMEQKNLQFAVTTSAALRSTVLSSTLNYMQSMISINGQALEYAKSVLSAVIEVYNTAVKGYGVKVDLYKAEIAVFEARIKEEFTKIELYKAEIDAMQALLGADRIKYEIYRTRIEAVNALASAYNSMVNAVQGQVSLEKLKIDIFQAQVQAYTAQVQGKNAEWQGYTAQLDGDQARVKSYEAQVRAYSGEVEAYKTNIEAQVASANAVTSKNSAAIAGYNSEVDAYKALVGAKSAKAQAEFGQNQDMLTAFKARLGIREVNARINNTTYTSTAQIQLTNATETLKAKIESAKVKTETSKAIAQVSTANAHIYGLAAQAALAGINVLAAKTLAE